MMRLVVTLNIPGRDPIVIEDGVEIFDNADGWGFVCRRAPMIGNVAIKFLQTIGITRDKGYRMRKQMRLAIWRPWKDGGTYDFVVVTLKGRNR